MNLRFEEEAKKEKRKRLIIEVILVIVLAWCIVHFALKKVTMIGSSMENTLDSGQEVIVNTFFKHFVSPGRNTVIAFYPVAGAESSDRSDTTILIRRIVGLPGERIKIAGGYIYVDGEKIEEKYDFDRNVSAGQAEQEVRLGDDEYFVLSDKRSDLDDSRSTSFTKVKKENIIGTVFLALDPFHLVSGPDAEETASPDATATPEASETKEKTGTDAEPVDAETPPPEE